MSVINTNIKALVARDAMTINNRNLATAMERLSTGKRINSAADDAAGLSIASKMDSQVRGLSMAVKNSNDAISVTQTAEGAMQEVNSILQRMRELAVQGANDSNNANDRAALQAEVSQLSNEIDRIATTTQFNGINVLDGGFSNKTFQIGSEAGQTLGISIGDMRSTALGVASSSILSSSSVVSSSAPASASAALRGVAEGAAATNTQGQLLFGAQPTSGGATATFAVTDSVSGITVTVTAVLDITNEFSKADFADLLNKTLKQSATSTSLAGGAVVGTATAAVGDITLAADADKFKFGVQIDSGEPLQNIDLSQRLASNGVTGTATVTAVGAAMQDELRSIFGDTNQSITVTFNVGLKFQVVDAEGRSIKLSQGAGSGTLFGTDVANSGALSVSENIQNSISAAFEGDAIVLTSSTGGDLTVDDVSYAGTTVTFTSTAGQEQQIIPVIYGASSISSIAAANNNQVTVQGRSEPTEMNVTFSNRTGVTATASAAEYQFQLTNGSGKIYASFSGGLNVFTDQTDAAIETAVRGALSVGLAAMAGTDSSIDLSEFDISFSNGTLSITNSAGRALGIENFSSSVGTMNVQGVNEARAVETLASASKLFTQVRAGVGTDIIGMSAAATAITNLSLIIDGVTIGGTAGVKLTSAANGNSFATGDAFATAIKEAISATSATNMQVDGVEISAKVDLTTITVAFVTATNEIVIMDTKGRKISFGLEADNPFLGSGKMLADSGFVTSTLRPNAFQVEATNGLTIDTDSGVTKGDTIQASRVDLTLSSAGSFNFKVNGQQLSLSGAAAVDVAYDPTENFLQSDLKGDLDALMTTLNTNYNDSPFEYSVSGNQISIWQREGGDIIISDFTTSGLNDDALTMSIADFNGDGTSVVASEMDFTASTVASVASGVLAQRTEVVMKLSGDDVYSMVINNGDADFTLSSTVLDTSDTTSVANFTASLAEALEGSGIASSLDLSGKIYFTRADGGQIGLKSFTSGSGETGTWTPKVGQGTTATLAGTGALASAAQAVSSSSSNVVTVGGGSVAVAQISVATQDGSAAAIEVLDGALTYVNAERSKLGAVENRLTHTIDNLSNVITNTEAARSRIMDTDYAVETSELARSQIIQQAATAMLAQANQSSQSVLSLLQ
jgi:flagellin